MKTSSSKYFNQLYNSWIEAGNSLQIENIHPTKPEELNFKEWFSYN